MSRRFTWIAVVVAGSISSGCLFGGHNSVNAHGGVMSLDSSDFDNIDEPSVYGLDAVVDTGLPWIGVEGGWFHSEDDASTSNALTNPDLSLDDYFLGVRVTPWRFLIEPYGGIGVNYVDGDLDAQSGGMNVGDSDEDFGYYARVGAAIKFAFVRIGLEGRTALGSELDLGGIDSDVDNLQVTAFLGVAF